MQNRLSELLRRLVSEILNAWLDAEADQVCGVRLDARAPDSMNPRAGHY